MVQVVSRENHVTSRITPNTELHELSAGIYVSWSNRKKNRLSDS